MHISFNHWSGGVLVCCFINIDWFWMVWMSWQELIALKAIERLGTLSAAHIPRPESRGTSPILDVSRPLSSMSSYAGTSDTNVICHCSKLIRILHGRSWIGLLCFVWCVYYIVWYVCVCDEGMGGGMLVCLWLQGCKVKRTLCIECIYILCRSM